MKAFAILLAVIFAAALFTACAEDNARHFVPPEITTEPVTTAESKATTTEEPEPQHIDFDEAFRYAVNYALSAYAGEDDNLLMRYTHGRIGWSAVFDGFIYIVNFETPEYEYDCEVDPVTGEVSNFTRNVNEVFDPEIVGLIHVSIDEEEALASALGFLDLAEDDVTDVLSEYDEEEYIFNVSFKFEETDYICEVDYKGEFLRSNVDIGPNGANDIAFEHMLDNADNYMMRDELVNFTLAGLMTNLRTDVLGGREDRQYQISFCVGGFSYNYLIDGLSGEVLQCYRNDDPTWLGDAAGAGYGNYISRFMAEKAAIEDAGISSTGWRFRRTTLDTTDREEKYIVYLETDERAYEYEIDAYSGDILSSKQFELTD